VREASDWRGVGDEAGRCTHDDQGVQTMKTLAVTLIALILLGVLVWFLSADHWWRRPYGVKVIYDGRLSPNALVYRSNKGDYLVDLKAHQDYLYLIHRFEDGKGSLWLVGTTWDFFQLPGFAISKSVKPPAVDLGGPKDETNPQLVVEEQSIEFTTSKQKQVRITWR